MGGAEARTSATVAPGSNSLFTVRRRASATSVSISLFISSSSSGSSLPTSNLSSSVLPSTVALSKSRMTRRPPSIDANSSCPSSGSPDTPPGAAITRRSASAEVPCVLILRLTQDMLETPEISAIWRPLAKTFRCLSTRTCHFGSPVSSAASPRVNDLLGVLKPLVGVLGRVLCSVDEPFWEPASSVCEAVEASRPSGTPYSQTSLPKKPAATSSPQSLEEGNVQGVSFFLVFLGPLRLGCFGPVK